MKMEYADGGGYSTRLLIALDVDGTTVRDDGVTISPRVHAAVRAVRSAGHHVVLATGRSPAATVPVTVALGLAGEFVVCSNGAVTLRLDPARADRYAVVAHAAFDPRALLAIIGREWPGGAVAVELPGAGGIRATASFPPGELPGDVLVVPWSQLGLCGASRLIVHAAENPARLARIADDLGFDCVADTTGDAEAVEIGPRGVSKAAALEALRVALKVAGSDTVAVGDHLNDVEMLRWAMRGIAMGDAPALLKEVANEVTSSCDSDGLAIALESIISPARTPTGSRPLMMHRCTPTDGLQGNLTSASLATFCGGIRCPETRLRLGSTAQEEEAPRSCDQPLP
ncbi:HAD family hydrolase [Micromonospora sp. DT233]|uniref:HAD family hydrolase n=1 Tax=Micromonospora sp. DT233 TaxID=3393432 RepID=UPI003CF4FA34